MASVNNIVRSYGLSHRQALLFARLRRAAPHKAVVPTGYDKRSMRVLVECELAEEVKGQPGAFKLADAGQPFGYHLANSPHFERIAPGVFRVRQDPVEEVGA
ncbi:hypothetical protein PAPPERLAPAPP_02140 [Brevundimonas phage vB_BpoS-Papperlapapp]|nr:hypothetical protein PAPPERLAPAPP_02140 [Brevundimonas phage vB_BpoS-Papperlapapp]